MRKVMNDKERKIINVLLNYLGSIYLSGVIFLTEPGTLNYLWFLK